MNKMWFVLAGVFFLFLIVGISAVKVQAVCGDCCDCGQYIDEDGDGICDLCDGCIPTYNPDAPDDDGDGIPNGQDDDYVPSGDQNGPQKGK